MKIVNRREFLLLPPNTVFAKYEPCFFGDISIKGDSLVSNDFWSTDDIGSAIRCESTEELMELLDLSERKGESLKMDFECEGRDGLFEDEQLFAVWEDDDVLALIERLKACVRTPSPPGHRR